MSRDRSGRTRGPTGGRAVALGWGFLTVLPAPRTDANPRVLGRAIRLFPAVGTVLGAALGAVGLVLELTLPGGRPRRSSSCSARP